MLRKLPGYEKAGKLGYTLNFYGGEKRSAVYTKNGIHLDIRRGEKNLEADLSFICGLLIVKTPKFSFPNKNFEVFENQIFLAKEKLG